MANRTMIGTQRSMRFARNAVYLLDALRAFPNFTIHSDLMYFQELTDDTVTGGNILGLAYLSHKFANMTCEKSVVEGRCLVYIDGIYLDSGDFADKYLGWGKDSVALALYEALSGIECATHRRVKLEFLLKQTYGINS